MGNFLENLKKDLENGEFNSEAAKRINDIGKLADEKKDAELLIEKRLKEAGVKTVTEEDVVKINSQYEEQLENAKRQDAVNKALATLIEIEDMVKASIDDMFSYVEELEHTFEKEFDSEDPMFGELYQKIEQIKSVYEPTLVPYVRKEV